MRILNITYLFFILLVGCSSVDSNTNNSNKTITNIASHQRVTDAVAKTESDYEIALEQKYDYLAPKTWKKAQKSMTRMRNIVSEFDADDQGFFGGPSEGKVLSYVNSAQQYLDKAKAHQAKASQFLAKPIADMDYLRPSITKPWQRDYSKLEKSLSRLIISFEKNSDINRHTKSKDKLVKSITLLEINIVKADIYEPLNNEFKLLSSRLIPTTYRTTKADLQKLNTTIQTSPRNRAEIDTNALTVKNDLSRAKHISSAVKWINKIPKSQRENIVLHYRNKFESLSKALLKEDLSTYSFTEQIEIFSNKYAELKDKNANINTAKIEDYKQQVERLKLEIESLSQPANPTIIAETTIIPEPTSAPRASIMAEVTETTDVNQTPKVADISKIGEISNGNTATITD